MAAEHVSYRAEFGISLHERGLNKASAGLRATQPEKFAFREEIPVGGDRTLTFYAVVSEPISFNAYPIAATPALGPDSIFMEVKVGFTLTDSNIGAITRLRLKLQAAAEIVRRDEGMSLRLLRRDNGLPWFDVIEIEGDHPESIRLVGGQLRAGDHSVSRMELDDDSDGPMDRAFRAIMDYLIDLWLRGGLEKTITEFPLPNLDDLIALGELGTIDGRELYVRNDELYLTLGDEALGDGGFPNARHESDLRIGLSETGLRRLLRLFAPVPIPISLGSNNTTFQVRARNFRISRIKANLKPGAENFTGQVFFGGLIEIRLNVKVFGRWARTPWFPLPIDQTLSQYAGHFKPYTEESDSEIKLRMRPAQDFLEAWAVLIVTDYRGFFADIFKRELRKIRRAFIKDEFCKIPIIGWIVCGTIDLIGDVLGWIVGTPLDIFMSSFLTAIINTIGRAILHFDDREEVFDLAKIGKAELYDALGLTVASGNVSQVVDNRGGELQLGLIFGDGSLPAPPAPLPVPPDPDIPPVDPFPDPDDPDTLPDYSEADFKPPYAVPAAQWQDGRMETYVIEVTRAGQLIGAGSLEVSYALVDQTWSITLITQMNSGSGSELTVRYHEDGSRPINANLSTKIIADGTPVVLSNTIDLDNAGGATVSVELPNGESTERTIAVGDLAYLELEDAWIFRMAAANLEAATGKLARIEVSDPGRFSNWARQIPMAIDINEDTIPAADDANTRQSVWIVMATDEESRTRLVLAKDGRGLLQAEAEREDVLVRTIRTMA